MKCSLLGIAVAFSYISFKHGLCESLGNEKATLLVFIIEIFKGKIRALFKHLLIDKNYIVCPFNPISEHSVPN